MNATYYVLYKENGEYKLTPCENHHSNIQDANKITTFKSFDMTIERQKQSV